MDKFIYCYNFHQNRKIWFGSFPPATHFQATCSIQTSDWLLGQDWLKLPSASLQAEDCMWEKKVIKHDSVLQISRASSSPYSLKTTQLDFKTDFQVSKGSYTWIFPLHLFPAPVIYSKIMGRKTGYENLSAYNDSKVRLSSRGVKTSVLPVASCPPLLPARVISNSLDASHLDGNLA